MRGAGRYFPQILTLKINFLGFLVKKAEVAMVILGIGFRNPKPLFGIFGHVSFIALFWMPGEFEMIKSWSLRPHSLAHESRFKLEKEVPTLATNNEIQTLRLFTCNLSSKAHRPSNLKDSGIARDLHPSKAPSPMAMTDFGKVILVKELQPRNARSPMIISD